MRLTLDRIAVGQGEQRLLEGDVAQIPRNDRATGVENRAVWTVHRITSAGLELRSVDDAIDTRVVSYEYAAEHVHLAYASTVHGIQGETTDASIAGPGVDASGLYVGLTRGRAHNEAIAIARTDALARDEIADRMMRGIPEVSIDDSMRAARSELGRAARLAADANDADLAQLNQWLRRARRKLLNLGSEISAGESYRHGRGRSVDSDWANVEARDLLAERYRRAEILYGDELRRRSEAASDSGGGETWSRVAVSAPHHAEAAHGVATGPLR
ncbi:hypothetical protein Q9S36_06615 [Microbacterium sp. ARD31]|uniref:hypothetical protein n=1 Tax=Microbacterium sp. ARD31 TaxID=2962576 RepID=UPI002881F5A0|nr:hypothetical protein [Microbacterium sp. ARD31]MDT0179883.1 hypothetical protein [Microbacterium sp. ARD31]